MSSSAEYFELFDRFPFGTLPDTHFALLRPETEELGTYVIKGARVLLEGPRRIGKTLLVKTVVPPEHLLLFDLKGLKTEERIVAGLRAAIEDFSGKTLGGTQKQTQETSGGTRSPLSYLRSSKKETSSQTDLETLFAEISRLGKMKPLLVVFFDEIQSLLEFEGGLEIADRIRSLSQHHGHLAYFFAGSNSHLLAQLTDEADTPFYKQLSRVTLRPIDREDFSVWIRKRLKAERLTISDETLAFVYDFARDIPGDVQRVLGDAFALARSRRPQAKAIDNELIEFAIQRALSDQAVSLDTIIDSLRRNQRFLMLAIAAQMHGGSDHPLTGSAMRRATRIHAAGTIDSTREALAKRGIVSLWQNRYLIDDPYLEAALIARYPADYEQIADLLQSS